MPSSTVATPAFVLFLSEPAAGARRAVQVRGLPFTVGTDAESTVRLRAASGKSLVRIEEGPDGLRVVDLAGDCLHCEGLLSTELPLHHGSMFEVGDAALRFLIGTREALRPRRERPKPEPTCPAEAHLMKLNDLEARVSELRKGLGRRQRRTRATSSST